MNELSLADVAALRGNNDGNGWGNGDGWWIILLFILLGGWGNRGFGGNQGGGGYGYAGGDMLYPWLNQAQLTTQGFADQNAVMALNGIQSSVTAGFANAATQLCNCCGDIQMALCNGFGATQNTVNQGFNATNMGMMQGFNATQMQTAQLASDMQLGNAQQTATILAENCADRAALSDGVRDIIASQTAGTQRIIDQLCQDKIDAKNDEIAQLRQQLNMQQLAASQQAQNAFITQGFSNEVDALYNRLNACPVPTTPVYGRTPIFTCNNGCGCGNGTLVG